ncbi:hypothetical protein FKP32DRAFT_1575251 [Trametes sanguinea]|nr:hypothetical protein FKP32DRAFT_1575251 [Trametes sanguinea]
MAPITPRIAGYPVLPPDIVMAITFLLSAHEQRCMLLSCWYMHDIVAPILYRSLDLWFSPLARSYPDPSSHRPLSVLACLVQSVHGSAANINAPVPKLCYTRHIVAISYVSFNAVIDLRGIPMLAVVLRYAPRLRHLRIEVGSPIVPLVLETFTRKSVIRSPTPSLTTMLLSGAQSTPWVLPELHSIRSTQSQIVEGLMRYRNIRTVNLQCTPNQAFFDQLCAVETPHHPLALVNLAIGFVPSMDDFLARFAVLALSFPFVEHLTIRAGRGHARSTFSPHAFPRLRAIGVNQGAIGPWHSIELRKGEEKVRLLGIDRPTLTTFLFGRSCWFREDPDETWKMTSTVVHLRLTMWMASCRAPAYAVHAITHRFCDVIHSPCTGSAWPLNKPPVGSLDMADCNRQCDEIDHIESHTPREVGLSPFERFLSGAPEKMVDTFFAQWSPDLIFSLRSLNSSTLFAVEAYIGRKWNIHRFIDRWFAYIPCFLSVLEECEGFISGAEAHNFFARESTMAPTLDVYVPFHGALRLGRWLQGCGFVYQPASHQHPFYDAAVMMYSSFIGSASVGIQPSSAGLVSKQPPVFTPFNFIRPAVQNLSTTTPSAHVVVMIVRGDPLIAMVNHFHATGIMNYITSSYAVSLFPRATFVDRTTLVCQDIMRNRWMHRAWAQKQRNMGYTVLTAHHTIPTTLEMRTWARKVGDTVSWVLPFQRTLTSMSRKDQGITLPNVSFEVLPMRYRVAAAGAALRVGSRFFYSSLAMVINPWAEFSDFHSGEVVAAFTEMFPIHPNDLFIEDDVGDGDFEDVTDDSETEDAESVADDIDGDMVFN